MPRKLTRDEFINNAIDKHGNVYDYSKVVYINSRSKVCIICPEHGEFWQTPAMHMSGRGCKLCGHNKLAKCFKKSNGDFINQSTSVHGDKYDYSNVEYKNAHKLVIITCKDHGDFKQTPHDHLKGQSCPKCGIIRQTEAKCDNYKSFIEKAKLIHNSFYKYPSEDYTGCREYITIECPIHGIFNQIAYYHLQGKGCPKCTESNGEKRIRSFLDFNGIDYISQMKYDDCKDIKPLPFDFYIPSENLLIEYDGIQHFKAIGYFGGQSRYLTQIKHDILKNEYVDNNGIKLLRIPHWDFSNIEEILKKYLLIS